MKSVFYVLRSFRLMYSKLFKINTLSYWKKRAKTYGSRAVLNLAHSSDEYQQITESQKSILFPILYKELNGTENLILDFGCGPGRFTYDLASLINGKCIGVDPVELFFPKNYSNSNVEFHTNKNNFLPLRNESVDIIWICLVLGGITREKQLKKAISEFSRVLKNGGLIFLVENTSEKFSTNYWIFRTVEEYKNMFSPFCILKEKGYYFDIEEKISILVGRKNESYKNENDHEITHYS